MLQRLRVLLGGLLIVAGVWGGVMAVIHFWPLDDGAAEAGPPPDLTGEWVQSGADESSYYQIATVRDNLIEVYWYTPEDGSRDLYWTGTVEVPEKNVKKFTWESQTKLVLNRPTDLRFALRDATKTFNYKDGKIIYTINDGHVKMGVALERVTPPPPAPPAENAD